MKYSKESIVSHLKVAYIQAERSKATRLKVGCVIVNEDRIVSTGRNGCVSGGSNVCEKEVDGKLITKQEVIHAEANAILWAARHGVKLFGCSIVLTHSPCIECSKMIIQSGIKEVFYENEYRSNDGITFLKNNNTHVERIYYGSK